MTSEAKKASNKRWRENNKDKLKAYMKEWRENNKDKTAAYNTTVNSSGMTSHQYALAVRRGIKGDVEKFLWTKRHNSRERAKSKGVPYDLTIAFLRSLFEGQGGLCPLTGLELSIVHGSPNFGHLDRVKPHLGYVQGNVRFIVDRANWCKAEGTDEDLIDFCRAVVQNAGIN